MYTSGPPALAPWRRADADADAGNSTALATTPSDPGSDASAKAPDAALIAGIVAGAVSAALLVLIFYVLWHTRKRTPYLAPRPDREKITPLPPATANGSAADFGPGSAPVSKSGSATTVGVVGPGAPRRPGAGVGASPTLTAADSEESAASSRGTTAHDMPRYMQRAKSASRSASASESVSANSALSATVSVSRSASASAGASASVFTSPPPSPAESFPRFPLRAARQSSAGTSRS